jgi:hypothetical protein
MAWFTNNKDLVGIALAVVAILVSLITVLLSRRQQQVTAFLQIQEVMLGTDLQDGRRLIYRAGEGQSPPTGEDLRTVARTLAMFNLLGSYVRRRIAPRRWVLDFWHARLRALRPGHDVMVAERVYWSQGRAPWPDLLDLLDRADRYRWRLLRPGDCPSQ